MIVCVRPAGRAAEATLLQAGDFRNFSVRLLGRHVADPLTAIGIGQLVGDAEALVSVAAVRRLADRAADQAWNEGFSAMLDYARSRGWLTEDGSQIRAHLEHAPGDP